MYARANLEPRTSATSEVLQDIINRHGITLSNPTDASAYLVVLQSADVTAQLVDDLPDFIDPRLAPTPTASPRVCTRPSKSQDTFNCWSHHTSLRTSTPTSNILHGLKLAIKDNISVAGIPYTCGTFPQLANPKVGEYPLPSIDAVVVKRVLDADAEIIGTSTCENYSLTPMSYTSANGPVDNPWLRGYNAGGSSSGNACLLGLQRAKQLGVQGIPEIPYPDAALGGDQAGSIRLPASYCGVYGLKPTHGLVPYTGIAGLHPMIDHTGPMANTLEDIAKILTAIAGYDGIDPRCTAECPLRENVRQYHDELAAFSGATSDLKQLGKGMKVGIITEALTSPVTSSEVAKVVEEAAMKHFAAAGAIVDRVSVPMHLLAPAIWTAASRTHMSSLTCAGRPPDLLSHNMPHWAPQWPMSQEMFDLLTIANPAVPNIILAETFLTGKFSPAQQSKANRHVFQLRAAYDMALAEYDVLVLPTAPTVAPPMPNLNEGEGSVIEKMRIAVGSTNHTCPFNITGHPGLSLPCGWGRASGGTPWPATNRTGPEGWLPVGMQVVGRRWDEMTVLKAAKVFEAGGGGLGQWPGVA